MILSIDVGIRHLSLCIMSAENKSNMETFNVHLWDVYNTLDTDEYFCESLQKSGKVCGKKCAFKWKNASDQIYCCKTHLPKEFVKNKKIAKENIFKKKLIKDYPLQTIAKIVLTRLQEIYDMHETVFNQLTSIIIEIQPTLNPSMKLVSHIIYGKLVSLYMDKSVSIKFVRASQKLKSYTGPAIECKLKGKYAQRKWLSVQYTRWFLENKFSKDQKEKWLNNFDSKVTKPDMGDTFLMCINAICGIPKKQRTDKNGKCIK